MRAPGTSLRALAPLSLFYWLANTMLRPLVAPYVASLGGNGATVGLVLAAHAVPAFLLALPVGTLTDRWGEKPFVVGGSIAMTIGALCLVLPGGGVPLVAAGQVAMGIGALAVWLCIQRLMMTGPAGEARSVRDARIARYSMLGVVGQLAGPAVGGILVDAGGYRLAFAVLGALTVSLIVLTPLVAYNPAAPPEDGAESGGWSGSMRSLANTWRAAGSILRTPGVLLTMSVSFLSLYLLDVRTAYQPLYMESIGLPSSVIGLLLSLSGACGLVARPLLVWLRPRLGSGTLVVIAIVPGALAVGSVVLVDQLPALLVLSLVSGLGLGMANPLTLILTADFTSLGERGLGVGLRLAANRVAQWVNPVVFSLLMAAFGMHVAFLCTGALMVVAAVVVGLRLNGLSPLDGAAGVPAR